MSVNHHMHPRNIYKKPPNFVKLALEYPEFKKFVKQDLSGKISVNFKEREAVLALTKALLQNNFGLSLTLPENRLVPTLPLRLNYILWLEDLLQLKHLARKEAVHGIDIGTGAACIYPLLAAKKNNWNMLATEVDSVSAEYANSNVASNELTDLIQVEQVSPDSVLLDVMKDKAGDFDFCMCNPPFFSSEDELECPPARNPPRNAPTGCKSELVAPGGEVAFVKRIIDDSIQLATKIRVYTTMLGKKTSLKDLQSYLGEKGKQMPSLTIGTTEFCQGHTTRWGLAWSFLPGLVMPDLVKTRKKNEKKKNPAVATLKNCTLSNAVEKLNLLFKELEIHTKLIKENPSRVEMSIIAVRNTWTHQRRKRRANKRQNKVEGDNGVNDSDKDGDSTACKKSRLDSDDKTVTDSPQNGTENARNLSNVVEKGKIEQIFANIESDAGKIKHTSANIVEKGKIEHISASVGSNVVEKEETEQISANVGSHVVEIEKIEYTSANVGPNVVEKEETEQISTNVGSHVVEKEKIEQISANIDENDGLDDYIGNKWADIDTLPLLTADLLVQNLGRDVMVAISLAEGCMGGWEVVHQIRQTIINRVDLKKD